VRLHLVEIHDLAACPPSLRDALTDFLAFTVNLGAAYDPAGPLLRDAVRRAHARRIVDLCSGAGGPWTRIAPRVGVPVLLTDLYPNRAAAQAKGLPCHPEPVNALSVPATLDGFRTIFTAFHHFRPGEARAILEDAVRHEQGIAVFEVSRRAPLEMAVIAFTWLATLALVPFVRPWRWSRVLWTYVPPVLPVVGTFDGLVSCLRTYSQAELRDLVRGLDSYDWDIGHFRHWRSPLRCTYLIGVPKRALAR
jgi:hypothetical protein